MSRFWKIIVVIALVVAALLLMTLQDLVYVYYFAVSPFKYYYHGSGEQICWGKSCEEADLVVPAAKTGPHRRLWLVAAHFPSLKEIREFAGELLGHQWRETACLNRASAALFCFEWQGPQLAKSPTSLPKPSESGPPTPPADRAYR